MEHLGVGLALRTLCGVEELEIVCDAQPGEHFFALLCPGVGADAHPHALGFQPGQHLPDAGLQLDFFVQVPDDLPHGRLVVPQGQGQIVGADEIFRALHHPHAQKNIVDAGSCGAAIAAQQLQRCALPHHGHAVGEGAVHVENPLLAVHLSSS